MQAKDIMTNKAEIISPDTTLNQAAEKMRSQDIGFLPIGENDRLIGAITDRDIVVRGLAAGKNADTTTVKDIMTNDIRYCFETDTLDKVAEIMSSSQIRRLAVLNAAKRIVGIISLGDVATKSENAALTGKVTADVSEVS
jgi:CBS domain-containing protein